MLDSIESALPGLQTADVRRDGRNRDGTNWEHSTQAALQADGSVQSPVGPDVTRAPPTPAAPRARLCAPSSARTHLTLSDPSTTTHGACRSLVWQALPSGGWWLLIHILRPEAEPASAFFAKHVFVGTQLRLGLALVSSAELAHLLESRQSRAAALTEHAEQAQTRF